MTRVTPKISVIIKLRTLVKARLLLIERAEPPLNVFLKFRTSPARTFLNDLMLTFVTLMLVEIKFSSASFISLEADGFLLVSKANELSAVRKFCNK